MRRGSIYPEWESLPLIPSSSAMNELWKNYLNLEDAKRVLEEGYGCAEGKRKEGVFEKCLERKGRIVKVVVARSYNYSLQTECWLIIHVGTVKL